MQPTIESFKSADLILNVSECLMKMSKEHSKTPSIYIPNGVDPALFYKSRKQEDFIPKDLIEAKESGKNIIGFCGAMWEHVTDWGLFVKICERYPDDLFVLTGSWLTNYGPLPDNMMYMGHVSEEAKVEYMKFFDVGTLPFLQNNFTRAMCPIKHLEYAMAGTNIISTPIPEVERHGMAYIGRDHDHFLERIPPAIHEVNPNLRSRAELYSWQNLFYPVIHYLKEEGF